MASIQLYNTLSRQTETFKPLKPGRVTLYTCGPTVYDYPHIGNWRAFVFYDTLSRTLRAHNFEVEHVLNITDVGHLISDEDEGEDKLVKAAKRDHKTAWDVAKFYAKDFQSGLKALNILKPTHMPRATDYIAQQIDFVKRLEAKGFTYQIDDGVYFDTSKLKDYGKLARLDRERLKAGARIEFNPQKRNITDFALWKLTPDGEKRDMDWESPWGKGFPGWHLECSVMAESLLGPAIDIHAGGVDHIPVHHTNEIAQSEAANGNEFAHYWLHTAHLTIDGGKIAKSLGNGVTLQDVVAKGFDPMALRLMYLQSHYKTEANFSWDNLQSAANRLITMRQLAELRWQPIARASEDEAEILVRAKSDLTSTLADNLNTPRALEVIAAVIDQLFPTGISPPSQDQLVDLLQQVDDLLGLNLMASAPDLEPEQRRLMAKRDEARRRGDFTESDKLRDRLQTAGVKLDDTPTGSLWHRI